MDVLWLVFSSALLYLVVMVVVNMRFNYQEYHYSWQNSNEDEKWHFQWHETMLQLLGIVELSVHLAYWITAVVKGDSLSAESRFIFYQFMCCLSLINYTVLIPSHLPRKKDRH